VRAQVDEGSLSWQRSSEPNQYLGRRVRHDRAAFAGEGRFPLTGKLAIRTEVDAYHDEFDDITLNENARVRAFAGLIYEKRPGLHSSINLGFGRGRSRPNDGFRRDVHSYESYLTGRIRGSITPKITGSAYAGVGEVRYRGSYRNRYALPVAGTDLTYGLDPRRTLVLAVYSGADYAPDGQAVDITRAFLSFTHVIVNRWQYILRGGPTHTVFRREIRQGTDRAWDAGAEFSYIPSARFRLGLTVSFTTQDSDAFDRGFDRTVTSLTSAYRF